MQVGITLFSFAGIPPLIGFFGKQMILSAAVDSGYIFMALVAILTSVISAVYYLAIIKQIFFDKPDYSLNKELKDFNADGLITEKNTAVEKVSIQMSNIVISSSLSLSISVITTTFFIIFIPILSILLLAINLLLAPHNPYQEKDSVFECGFHSFLGQNRTQFSVSFFIFGLLFLLFDLEILLVYPYSVSSYTNDIYGLVIMM
ncbi:hypothetical protein LEMA_P124110.1 [Plenodomus lingam JN3]|uniref:NADH-ubiquinone oxidoreductase chain 2 n=1 Tax=Leptosphaeria maculans (strain JN3 / isolate v23.1.3 / race Av1-4-5-6-7-8) TaxID=985895 RepID=E4ZQ83_LEPMJ|nr:hypothetical protein LEMA_P124110.1 [Plenodomus lingam JN3]CBX89993.1 hypothetical protein LEMA_P124110.1 [Plenodomus lingam JN3]